MVEINYLEILQVIFRFSNWTMVSLISEDNFFFFLSLTLFICAFFSFFFLIYFVYRAVLGLQQNWAKSREFFPTACPLPLASCVINVPYQSDAFVRGNNCVWKTFYFKLLFDLEKSCKNNIRTFLVFFTLLPLRLISI